MPRSERYYLHRRLGQGSFGEVWEALGPRGERVAIKRVCNVGSMLALALEARALMDLSHPHIVGCHGYHVDREGQPCIIMELVEGVTLRERLRRGQRFDDAEIIRMLAQLGAALAHAHAKKLAHRDIKPENIMVCGEGQAAHFVLVDFGLAHAVGGLSRAARRAGTLPYMAPEQTRGRPGLASDLWSLGIVAHEMASGTRPFHDEDPHCLMQKIARAPYPAEDCPNALRPIIGRMLERAVEHRIDAAGLCALLGVDPTDPCNPPSCITPTPWHWLQPSWLRGFGLLIYLISMFAIVDHWALRSYYLLEFGCILGVLHVLAREFNTMPQRRQLVLAAMVVGLMATAWVIGGFVGALGDTGSFAAGRFMIVVPAAMLPLELAARLERARDYEQVHRAWSGDREALLRTLVDRHPHDVTLRVRYAENLLALGRPRDAAVEAWVAIRIDYFHLDANIVLADAYTMLGLYKPCLDVCNHYLRRVSYVFELAAIAEFAAQELAHA